MTKALSRKTFLISELNETLKKDMFSLFEKYYDHVDYDRFLSDLNEKTHVFMFFDKDHKKLAGFSTIFRKSIPEIASGSFLFSGDTVIHEDYWGSKSLQKSFFWFILESKFRSPLSPLYWMLMSKGVKTYLMMRKNFVKSYPNHLGPTPTDYSQVQKSFYQMKFPENYRPEKDLILFKEKMGSVKAEIITPHPQALLEAESKFFYRVNPGHLAGDELACICEIRFTDFLLHIFKFFIPVLHRRDRKYS